jgi:hypothetical protein
MKRISFIVLWVFVFAFGTGIGFLLISIGLYTAGFESCSDFLMKKLLIVAIYVMPVTALLLGLLGRLPGTKEKKPSQTSVKSAFADFKVRLAFLPLIGFLFTPDEAGNDKRDDV